MPFVSAATIIRYLKTERKNEIVNGCACGSEPCEGAAVRVRKVFVHVHIFYPELWPRLREALKSIVGVEWELCVTVVEERAWLSEEIRAFKPDAQIRVVENRGWDVWPFLDTLERVSLADYDYVIKLHTKRDYPMTKFINGFSMRGSHWREYLLEFLRTPEIFRQCLQAFDTDPRLGVVADFRLIRDESLDETFFRDACAGLLERAGLPRRPFRFVPGTMFMVREALLEPLKAFAGAETFSVTERFEQNGLAHQMERFFGALVYAQGCTIEDVFTPLRRQRVQRALAQIFSRLSYFFFQDAITASGYYLVKICKIPVWRKALRARS